MTLSTPAYMKEEKEIVDAMKVLVLRAQKIFHTTPEIGNPHEELEALGTLVSKYCLWDGCDVLSASIAALNDCNWKDTAAKVQALLDIEIDSDGIVGEEDYGYADQKNFD